MTNAHEVAKAEDSDGFNYESAYVPDADDSGGGGMLAGTTRIAFGPPWQNAASKEPLLTDLELLAVKVERVVIRFHGTGEAPETRIIAPGEPFPSLRELNASVPQTEWRQNKFTGELEGPWSSQHVLFLLDEISFGGYAFVAPCATVGSTIAVEDLIKRIRFKRKVVGAQVLPIVRLADTFMKTRFNGRPRPHFEVVRWVVMGGDPALPSAAESKQIAAAPPTAPAALPASPARVPEMGPKLATPGEQTNTFPKTGLPLKTPISSADLDDDLPF